MIDQIGDVSIFGRGMMGGKGAGLVKINKCNIPGIHKLRTVILSTSFYDRFLDNNGLFSQDEFKALTRILNEFNDIPISVRSSATNEAFIAAGEVGSVHAGENTSFMLPNNHPNATSRFEQLKQAIYFIYQDFIGKQHPGSQEKMAIVVNPIPGRLLKTRAGDVYCPLVSGVANSFFPYALKTQDPNEGFARLAFGHGYATVLDDFQVVSMATIQNPLLLDLLRNEQAYFYAIDMTKNENLLGYELETMKKLSITFVPPEMTKRLGTYKTRVTFESLIQHDNFGFKSTLRNTMEAIREQIASHFQIEFVFNINRIVQNESDIRFHVVQLTRLPELKFDNIQIPNKVNHTYLSIRNLQGHGIKYGIKNALIVSPFIYTKAMHNDVKDQIRKMNDMMCMIHEPYILIVPGRLGTSNLDWGIHVDYTDVNGAAAIFEYGVDIAGRPEPLQETDEMMGGIYGSHFLYMIQGGFDEEQKRIQTRKFGTQGTHFLTNLQSNATIYGYIIPGEDHIDPWFFTPPEDDMPVYRLTFPEPVVIYADSTHQQCVLVSENERVK